MRFIKKTLLILISITFLTALFSVKTFAANTVPRRLNYQGRLMDASDNLLTGTYYICFSIWDNPTVGAGSQVWPASTPTPTAITTSNGVFSAEVGSADALSLDFDAYDYYLQVYVNTSNSCSSGGENLSPRQHLTSSAYSINADMLDGYDAGVAANNILLLDAEGDIDFDGEVFMNDGKKIYLGTGNDAQLYTDASDDLYIANVTSNQDIYFQVNDGGTTKTPIFIQGSTGNVGMGTTSTASAKLVIDTTSSTISGLISANEFFATTLNYYDATWPTAAGFTALDNSGSVEILHSASGAVDYGISITLPTASTGTGIYSTAGNNGIAGSFQGGGGSVEIVDDTYALDVMGMSNFSSYVGIGTTPLATALLTLGGATSGYSPLNITNGTVIPNTPIVGDINSYQSSLYYYDGSSWVDLTAWIRTGTTLSPKTANDVVAVTSSTGVPLTLTNTGTGNSFVVNDEATDTSPFVIDASGNVTMTSLTLSTALSVANGGTGATTLTDGGLLVGAGTGAIEALGVGLTTQILVGGGAGTNPAWGTDLPTAVTIGTKYVYRADGTDVAVADGGTGLSSYVVGDLLYASGTTTIGKLADVAVGQVLVSGGVNTAPAWSDSPTLTTVKLTGLTDGYIPYHVSDATGLADSVIYTDGTKVGIGGAPSVKLEVVSGSMGSPYSAISALSGAANKYTALSVGRTTPEMWFAISGGANNYVSGSVAGDGAIVHTGKLLISSSIGGAVEFAISGGNVGIGTASPESLLDIRGTGIASTTQPILTLSTPNDAVITTGSELGQIQWSYDDNSSGRVRQVGAKIHAYGTEAHDGTNAGTAIGFSVLGTASETVEDGMVLYSTASGDQRLGVGTVNPGARIHGYSTGTAATVPPIATYAQMLWQPASKPGVVYPIAFQMYNTYDSTYTPDGGYALSAFMYGVNANTGTIPMYILDIGYDNQGSGTVTVVRNISMRAPLNGGGGTIDRFDHIKMPNVSNSGVTTATGLDSDLDLVAGKTRWNIFAEGTAPNYFAGNVGIGTTSPTGKLSVTPTQYSTGTASQALTTITGVGTTWTSAMVGSQFVYANGTNGGTITAFGSATSLTVSTSQTVSSQAYTIAYTGLQVGSTGNVGIGTTSPGSSLHAKSATANDALLVEDDSGACEAAPTTTGLTWSCSSDQRLKTDISEASPALSYLTGISLFDYTVIKTGERVMGPVAQEMLKNYPELVSKGEDGLYKVSEVGPWKIVKAIQEQQIQIEELKLAVNTRETKVANSYVYDDSAILASIEAQKLRIDGLDKLSPLANMLELATDGEFVVKAEYKLIAKGDLQAEGKVISANTGHSVIPLITQTELPTTEKELLTLKQLTIENKNIGEKTQIMITPTTPLCGNELYVSEKETGVGFTVTLEDENTCEHDIEFDWWMVDSM